MKKAIPVFMLTSYLFVWTAFANPGNTKVELGKDFSIVLFDVPAMDQAIDLIFDHSLFKSEAEVQRFFGGVSSNKVQFEVINKTNVRIVFPSSSWDKGASKADFETELNKDLSYRIKLYSMISSNSSNH